MRNNLNVIRKPMSAYTRGVALIEKPLDEGLTRGEVADLFDLLHGTSGIPIEIQAEHSTAMGFINLTDAEAMNYDYTALKELLVPIMNDMDKESPDHNYSRDVPGIGAIDIWMSR